MAFEPGQEFQAGTKVVHLTGTVLTPLNYNNTTGERLADWL